MTVYKIIKELENNSSRNKKVEWIKNTNSFEIYLNDFKFQPTDLKINMNDRKITVTLREDLKVKSFIDFINEWMDKLLNNSYVNLKDTNSTKTFLVKDLNLSNVYILLNVYPTRISQEKEEVPYTPFITFQKETIPFMGGLFSSATTTKYRTRIHDEKQFIYNYKIEFSFDNAIKK